MSAVPLGPLGVSALALLVERPMHPYEMFQTLVERRNNRVVKVRPGTLYHTVDKLAEHGLVEATGTGREGNRPERTSYAITPAGRRVLEQRVIELLETPVNEYPVFPVAIGEAHNLPRTTVLELLRKRLDRLREEAEAIRTRLDTVKAEGLPRRWWLAGDYALHHLDADISWTSGVVADLESGELAWPDSHAYAASAPHPPLISDPPTTHASKDAK